MIISLEDASEIDPKVTQDDLDAFEVSVREITSRNFQNTNVRYRLVAMEDDTITTKTKVYGLRTGDTIEVNCSKLNDGLYTVKTVEGNVITVESGSFYKVDSAMITKVEYPADIKQGVKKLIQYDLKMGDKLGVKSETYSRVSKTYYDVGVNDSEGGYPKHLMSFLDKYTDEVWT